MANKKNVGNLEIENARIFFKNFEGRGSKYNREGDRNFAVEIENSDEAKMLIEDGWNVRISKPRDEDDEPRYYIPVSVRYFEEHDDWRNPTIYIVSSGRKKIELDANTVKCLDHSIISNVDLVIRPRQWQDEVSEEWKVKAFAKSMYITLDEDRFASKYADADDEN